MGRPKVAKFKMPSREWIARAAKAEAAHGLLAGRNPNIPSRPGANRDSVKVSTFLRLAGGKEIELLSFSWGAHRLERGTGKMAKASLEDFTISKEVDDASPKLMEWCANGSLIKDAVLVTRRGDSGQVEVVEFKIYDVLVSDYRVGQSPGEDLTEHISFTFARIEMTVSAPKREGAPASATQTGSDIKKVEA